MVRSGDEDHALGPFSRYNQSHPSGSQVRTPHQRSPGCGPVNLIKIRILSVHLETQAKSGRKAGEYRLVRSPSGSLTSKYACLVRLMRRIPSDRHRYQICCPPNRFVILRGESAGKCSPPGPKPVGTGLQGSAPQDRLPQGYVSALSARGRRDQPKTRHQSPRRQPQQSPAHPGPVR